MSKVLAVNAGSSSLKFQLLEMPEAEVLVNGIVERIGLNDGIFTIKYDDKKDSETLEIPDHTVAVKLVLDAFVAKNIVADLNDIIAVGHRVVHGGEFFKASAYANEEAVAKVEALANLAPLHNPANLIGYYAFKEALPKASHSFIFDTAFHQTMSEESYIYPLPYEYYTDHEVRRYGAHGTSHEYVSHRVSELMERTPEGMNVITLHLGNGASITAVKDGKSINTSMGFTPLGGVMMGTRTGDLDPAITPYLMDKLDISADEMINIFNRQSGMLGLSGLSSDARDIDSAIKAGHERAILTRKVYAHRIMQFIGAYAFQLKHVDALVFTAGLGENDTGVREAILDLVAEPLGINFDRELNNTTRGQEIAISTPDSKVAVWIVPTNEELVLASDAFRIYNERL